MRKNFLKNDPNLKECVQVLNELKINHWLCYGTLLGVVRNNYLLPWDNDIDIGLWDQKNKNIIINAFVKKRFTYNKKFLETKIFFLLKKAKIEK